jgi:hypothetical protein
MGTNGSHRITLSSHTSKAEDRCLFNLGVYLDRHGYFLKTRFSSILHQFHACRDHLRVPTTLCNVNDHQMQQDMNSARAKTGIAVNLHYV